MQRLLAILHGVTMVVLLGAWSSVASANDRRPNIVVLLADDLGWAGVGYHDRQFQTPHIDTLVASGMELNRFYVAPMCSPTRAGLMTGRYPIRFGLGRAVIPPHRDFGLPPEETTLPEALAEMGYQHRGIFGKWHLGHLRPQWHPLRQGFTHFHGHYNGAIDYFELTREGQRDWHVDWQPSDEQGYSTHLIASAAAAWIGQVAPSEAPYFCYVPFNAPHSPFQAPEESISRLAGNSSDVSPTRKQILAAMIWEMDRGIGEILAAVEQSGESDNTIVWFASDNGGVASISGNNRPLRGSKLTVYEGGIRVPAAVRWPDRIAAGSRTEELMGYIDVFPTLVSAAGADSIQRQHGPLDGIDLLPVLVGDTDARPPKARPWFSYHGQSGLESEHLAVTLDGWKLKVNGPRLERTEQLRDGTNQLELFHLAEDPLEKENLAQEHPTQVEQLATLLVEHRDLQPADAVPPYAADNPGFVPPVNWRLSPESAP